MALKGPISHGAVPYKSVLANDAVGLYFRIWSEILAIGFPNFLWSVEILKYVSCLFCNYYFWLETVLHITFDVN